jgi:hypothetical protein
MAPAPIRGGPGKAFKAMVHRVHLVNQMPKPYRLVIRCDWETFVAFREYAARFRTYEDALLDLLACRGVVKKRFEII